MTDKIEDMLTLLTSQEETELVNARDLHKVLGVKSEFSHWIKGRIKMYDFKEGVDFFVIKNSPTKKGRPLTEYKTTTDMAREICVTENNKIGRFVRKFYIECERKLNERTDQASAETYKEVFTRKQTKQTHGF